MNKLDISRIFKKSIENTIDTFKDMCKCKCNFIQKFLNENCKCSCHVLHKYFLEIWHVLLNIKKKKIEVPEFTKYNDKLSFNFDKEPVIFAIKYKKFYLFIDLSLYDNNSFLRISYFNPTFSSVIHIDAISFKGYIEKFLEISDKSSNNYSYQTTDISEKIPNETIDIMPKNIKNKIMVFFNFDKKTITFKSSKNNIFFYKVKPII